MNQSQIILHNVKMYALIVIPIILTIIGSIHGGMTSADWIALIIATLIGIEHTLNGNTTSNTPIPTAPTQ